MKWVVSVTNGEGETCFVLCQWTSAVLKIVDCRKECTDGCAHGL
jgi:hypothetical protein